MKYCLLDTENINRVLASTVYKFDEIFVFVSPNSPKPRLQIKTGGILSPKIRVICVVGSGKNNMDFHITGYCGYLLGKNKDAEVSIISNDRDFDNVRMFWIARGRVVIRKGYNLKKETNKKGRLSSSKGRSSPNKLVKKNNNNLEDIHIPKIKIKVSSLLGEYLADDRIPIKTVCDLGNYIAEQNYMKISKLKKEIIKAGYLVDNSQVITRPKG